MEVLESVTKQYAEVRLPILSEGPTRYETVVVPVSERNPLDFGYKGTDRYEGTRRLIAGVRFFEIGEVIMDDGETYYSKEKNYSPMYYNGKRLNLDEVEEKFNKLWRQILEDQGLTSIVLSPDGNLIFHPDEGSLTVEEYLQQIQAEAEQTPSKEI